MDVTVSDPLVGRLLDGRYRVHQTQGFRGSCVAAGATITLTIV